MDLATLDAKIREKNISLSTYDGEVTEGFVKDTYFFGICFWPKGEESEEVIINWSFIKKIKPIK